MSWKVMTVGVVAVGFMASAGYAAEAGVTMDLASAYVFRGETFNDGAVLQPGVEVGGMPIPLTVGVWANLDMDDYGGTLEDGQFSEVDLYLSWALPAPGEKLSWSVGYTEYTYPGAAGDVEAGLDEAGEPVAEVGFGVADRELSLSLGLESLLSPALTVYYGVDGGIEDSLYAELAVGHDIAAGKATVSLSGTVAYADPDGGQDGFSNYTASLGVSYGCLAASVTYVGQIDDEVLVDVEDGGAYDTDVYGKLSMAYEF
jgi:uncharacterized protein (TIGR02001 family)